MKHIVIAFLAGAVIAGCAGLDTSHANCVNSNKLFSEVTRCINETLGSDSDPRVQMYVLKANQLNGNVEKGVISDLDARVALQETMLGIYRDAAAAYGAVRAMK